MKLLYCNGKILKVYDIGEEPVMTLAAGDVPIKLNGYHIMKDEDARERIKDLMLEGHTKI